MNTTEKIVTPFPFPVEKKIKEKDTYFFDLEANITSLFNAYHMYYKKRYNLKTPFIMNPVEMADFQKDFDKSKDEKIYSIEDDTPRKFVLSVSEIPVKKGDYVMLLLGHVLENGIENWEINTT